MTTAPWAVALLAATALHAGFQLTVTVLVYPVLAATPAAAWSGAHQRHARRITPLVGLVYLAVLVASAGALLTAPGPAVRVAVAATAVALGLTAGVAAPLHGRLGAGRDAALLRRLLRADRLRSLAAVLALAAAAVAAAG
ncbi:hypothetical protein SAMN04488543_4123 [Friedmanniella luteola]|uniref:DUF1772 domain-containing protein n=1 Tax=Friedmanniella luteola TaxID=546871 RepID=A0A1H2A1A2_9ACTN|nr:hypothetical protein [Friedmanniella luteola]SDT39276.1 hypothetical protein SAMN04488543_4123 [Friedmanniella luteola]